MKFPQRGVSTLKNLKRTPKSTGTGREVRAMFSDLTFLKCRHATLQRNICVLICSIVPLLTLGETRDRRSGLYLSPRKVQAIGFWFRLLGFKLGRFRLLGSKLGSWANDKLLRERACKTLLKSVFSPIDMSNDCRPLYCTVIMFWKLLTFLQEPRCSDCGRAGCSSKWNWWWAGNLPLLLVHHVDNNNTMQYYLVRVTFLIFELLLSPSLLLYCSHYRFLYSTPHETCDRFIYLFIYSFEDLQSLEFWQHLEVRSLCWDCHFSLLTLRHSDISS